MSCLSFSYIGLSFFHFLFCFGATAAVGLLLESDRRWISGRLPPRGKMPHGTPEARRGEDCPRPGSVRFFFPYLYIIYLYICIYFFSCRMMMLTDGKRKRRFINNKQDGQRGQIAIKGHISTLWGSERGAAAAADRQSPVTGWKPS